MGSGRNRPLRPAQATRICYPHDSGGPHPSVISTTPARSLDMCDSSAADYVGSGARDYGFSPLEFAALIAEAEAFYLGPKPDAAAQAKLRHSLHLRDLVLARACARGHETAWQDFLHRYQPKLRAIAQSLLRDRQEALELADSLYGDLYGLRFKDGVRISKFSRYMGGGSLEAWLRIVLAQKRVDEWRRRRWTISLEDAEPGALRAATVVAAEPQPLPALRQAVGAALGKLPPEDKLVLALYFLDGRHLAEIGRLFGVHESTMSRRVHRLEKGVRRTVVRELARHGMSRRATEEALQCDVRSLELDVRRVLTPADKMS